MNKVTKVKISKLLAEYIANNLDKYNGIRVGLDYIEAALVDDNWHYKRTCLYCGNIWGGLHCIHDGYQNPCPKCGKIPLTINSECECNFDF